MYRYEISITHRNESENTLVNRQEYIVGVDGDPKTEDDIPYFIEKRNRAAVKDAIIKYIDDTGVYEGDTLYIEHVKRIK